MKIDIVLDRYGVLRARVPEEYEPLGRYLEDDLQEVAENCDYVLERIAKVEQAELASWEGTGNAHTVTLDHDGVKIETEFAIPEQSVNMTFVEFKAAIEEWRSAIELRRRIEVN